MPSPFWLSAGVAVLMAGLLIQVLVFHVMHEDPSAVHRLFAVRDKIIRLVILGKVARNERHLNTLYQELNVLVRSSRDISGPDGWPLAAAQGKHLARYPDAGKKPIRMSVEEIPEPLRPVAAELRAALEHLLRNHHGIYLQVDAKRREAERIRRARARALLDSMPETMCEIR
jgi:hypothetical protein